MIFSLSDRQALLSLKTPSPHNYCRNSPCIAFYLLTKRFKGCPCLWIVPKLGPIKGGLSVGCQLEILRNVQCRLKIETVSVRLKWSVKCRVTKSECRCRAPIILGWMSVSDRKKMIHCQVSEIPPSWALKLHASDAGNCSQCFCDCVFQKKALRVYGSDTFTITLPASQLQQFRPKLASIRLFGKLEPLD